MKLIKNILFHRITYLALAFGIQLVLLIGIILRFSRYFVYFYGFSFYTMICKYYHKFFRLFTHTVKSIFKIQYFRKKSLKIFIFNRTGTINKS